MNGKFGIELECFGVSMNTVVDAFNRNGIETFQASYSGRDYSKFQIKYDGSIQGSQGFEVVSPILEGEQGIQTVRKVCEILVGLNAQVNKSTGFHIHHNVANWGIKEFRNIYKRFIKFEDGLDAIQPASRRANENRYIGSVTKLGLRNAQVTSIKDLFKAIDKANSIRKLHQLFQTRYLKLNMESFFRQGSIEFRHHSGTVDADKVENYIRLTYAMVSDAENHVAIKAFTEQTTSNVALDTMLQGMVRRNNITKEVAKFYQTRATQLVGVQ